MRSIQQSRSYKKHRKSNKKWNNKSRRCSRLLMINKIKLHKLRNRSKHNTNNNLKNYSCKGGVLLEKGMMLRRPEKD